MNQGDYIFLGLAGVILLISIVGYIRAKIDERND